MRLKLLAFFLVLTWLGMGASFASGKVGVSLYLAENGPPPPNAILAPEKLGQRLHQVFGFKHYRLLKGEDIILGNEWEQWVVPRNDFFIRVKPLPHRPDEPRLVDYEIYKDGFIVAKGKFEPSEGVPLFINGPDFHSGRLIFVLEAQ
jgi:hypothetical protein